MNCEECGSFLKKNGSCTVCETIVKCHYCETENKLKDIKELMMCKECSSYIQLPKEGNVKCFYCHEINQWTGERNQTCTNCESYLERDENVRYWGNNEYEGFDITGEKFIEDDFGYKDFRG